MHAGGQLSEKHRGQLTWTHLTKQTLYATQHGPDPALAAGYRLWLHLLDTRHFSSYATPKGPSNTMSPYWASIRDVIIFQMTGFEVPRQDSVWKQSIANTGHIQHCLLITWTCSEKTAGEIHGSCSTFVAFIYISLRVTSRNGLNRSMTASFLSPNDVVVLRFLWNLFLNNTDLNLNS